MTIPRRLALVFLCGLGSLAPGADEGARPASPVPSPALTPDRVIEIQLAALQFNDRPTKDAGIVTTFRFASPGNRKATGPLDRFTRIVKGPAFRPLIDHRIAGFGPLVEQDGLALCRVTVVAADGQAVDYEFRLARDPESACWFTEGVIPIPARPPVDPGKVARNSQNLRSSRTESFLHLLQPVLSSEPG